MLSIPTPVNPNARGVRRYGDPPQAVAYGDGNILVAWLVESWKLEG